MKTKLILLMLITGLGLNAQTIPTPDFENWVTNDCGTSPNLWWSSYCTATQTTDAYQGTYASKIQGFMCCGIAQGMMVNGKQPSAWWNIINAGTPFKSKISTFSGYYKYTDVTAGDSAEVIVILKKYNSILGKHDTVAYGTAALAPSSNYTKFMVNIKDCKPGIMPDSIITIFNSSKYLMLDTIWSMPILYIDNIDLPEADATMGIEENTNTLLQSVVYPNPFSDKTSIVINDNIRPFENLQVDIFDGLGKKVKSVSNINGNKGEIDRNDLSKGTYFYQVNDKESVISKGNLIVTD